MMIVGKNVVNFHSFYYSSFLGELSIRRKLSLGEVILLSDFQPVTQMYNFMYESTEKK